MSIGCEDSGCDRPGSFEGVELREGGGAVGDASNKAPREVADFVAERYRTRHFDFTPKHFYVELRKQGFLSS